MDWVCTGRGLTVVLLGPDDLPVVCPIERLGDLDKATASAMRSQGGPWPFRGGDHLHLVLGPERDRVPAEDVESSPS